ncbi:hypothetical protein [Edaphobacter sp. 12200R-103]|jgi:hypothetical protein|nr:hypothetical protein [Edaphobacter sp. 12200R-103]QHS51265.1 hypothetical protein GWR55_05560 [Edaphobacter sp. 12200R-103]
MKMVDTEALSHHNVIPVLSQAIESSWIEIWDGGQEETKAPMSVSMFDAA